MGKKYISLKIKLLVNKTMLWHQRLGLIGEKELWALKRKNLVHGLNNCTFKFDFVGIVYIENRSMLNFILVLTNILGCWT
jgi:hypothetical protein